MPVSTVYEEKLRLGGDWVVKEAGEFFDGGGTLRRALRGLVERLDSAGIHYALLGGLALAEHGYARMTQDIDLLLSPAGLDRFRQKLVGFGYRPAFEGARKTFRDVETGVRIKVITVGEYPGDGRPKSVAFPNPGLPGVAEDVDGIRVIALQHLVELKLASGQSAPHRRRDLADVQDLIRARGLPEELAEQLDDSVRELYRQIWAEAQVDDQLQEQGKT